MKKIVIAIIAVVLLALFFFLNNNNEETEKMQQETNNQDEEKEEAEYKHPPEKAQNLLDEQEQLESDILSESEGSTLDDPYVKLDPYNRSPLAALVIFDTNEAAKVSFTVKGKHDETNISKTMKDFKTHHELPVLGLYPDHDNTVKITAETESGETLKKTITISTGELPDYIPDVDIKTVDKNNVDIEKNELTFAIPSTKFFYGFDINGDIRWYGSGYNSHVLQELNNGHLLYLGKDDNSGTAYNRLFETDYMGKLYNAFKISDAAAEREAKGME